MFMVIAAMLIVIIFMSIFSELHQNNLTNRKMKIFEDLGYGLQAEIILASQVHTGYTREFFLPDKLYGYSYEATVSKSMLLINYTENIFSIPIPNITGSFVKGTNTIINQDGNVFLN